MKYYLEEFDKVLTEVGSDEDGIKKAEVGKRLEEYGPNKLEEKKKTLM